MNFLQRCWQKRWLRRLTWTGVTLITLYALLCAWVNWSGARQWRATVAMLKAEGETLDFRETLYDAVPEDENFCAIPLLKDLVVAVDEDMAKGAQVASRKRLEVIKTLPYGMQTSTNPTAGTRADISKWADYLRKEGSLPMPADSGDPARDLLSALSKYDPITQELAAGLNRTKAHWLPERQSRSQSITQIFEIPDLRLIFLCFRLLDMRAIAAVRSGDAAKAHESALIEARLCQAWMNEPFILGLMVSGAGSHTLSNATWELCAAHAGTDDDFVRLESALVGLDFERAFLHSARSEMAAMCCAVRAMKSWRGDTFRLWNNRSDKLNRSLDMLMRALPAGFFDANATVVAELEFRHIIKPFKEHGWKEALVSANDSQNELRAITQKPWAHPSGIIAARLIPAPWHVIFPCIYAQTLVNQAVIACALERHRIEKGSYPDSLDGVRLADGRPLPPDPMDGKPMRYRKTANGRYVLWSIGPDGKDDGGKRIIQKNSDAEHTPFDFPDYVGDLVWDFPA